MDSYANLIIMPLLIFAVAACCSTAAKSHRSRLAPQDTRDMKICVLFAVVFLMFMVMKMGSVVEMITNAARQESKDLGMYNKRRPYQLAAVVAAAVLWLAQLVWYSRYIAMNWRRYRLPLIGTASIVCFSAIRAVSLHEIDHLGVWLVVSKIVIESLSALLTIWGAVQWFRRIQTMKLAGTQ